MGLLGSLGFISSWLVVLPRCELYGCPKDILIGTQRCDTCNAEIFVWRATEATEIVVFARPYQMPVDQITRAIESRSHIALAEETTLNDAVNGFEDVGRFEFERARSVETLDSLCLWHGEVEDGIVSVHRQRIGIGVEVRGKAREYHAPLLRLERIDISVGNAWRIDNDTLMHIVVNHLTIL